MTARIKEMKMKREINTIAVIMGGKHIKSMPEVKTIEVTVPAPGGIRIGIMPGAGADPNPVFGAGTDLMPIGERMGMDACAITGENEPVRRNEPGVQRREQGSKAEKFLKEFLIMKRELIPGNCLSCDDFSNAGMPVREFFSF